MFPWNIAKSAEAMFSQWAIKHVCKFILKKKLGQFIHGDIDLDQLDVQLGAGTIQLTDLALNADYLNQKLGSSAVIVKEGSIGSLLVKFPWKGKSCQIEVDELEILLAPSLENHLADGAGSYIHSQDGKKQPVGCSAEKFEQEFVSNAATSTSIDVHEGVKTIAKMVKWLLTSFHVKIKKLIVALDPCSDKDEKKSGSHTTLVLRITETECGTCVSEDSHASSDAKVDSFLGMTRLTNFVKFQGAIVELLQMDDVDNQPQLPCAMGATLSDYHSEMSHSNVTTPILTGESGGFSGIIKLSIPWKNGSLDIRKVDADVSIEPLELRFQPHTIKWCLSLWESLKIMGMEDRDHMHCKAVDSVYHNSVSQFHFPTMGSVFMATERMTPNSESSSMGFCSLTNQETATDNLLPGSHFIPDWVPLSINKNQKDRGRAEPDFGASIDQFFECFDGMRTSQSALGNSGMWNWTCSVFSAITAASSLASGSLLVPAEQQHVETKLKATIAGISVVLSFQDEGQKHACDLTGDHTNIGQNEHYLGVKCRDLFLSLQIRPQEMKFDAMVEHIEVDDYFNTGIVDADFGSLGCENSIYSQILLIQLLQAEVQHALPPFPLSVQHRDLEKPISGLVVDFPCNMASTNGGTGRIDRENISKGDLVKVKLLETSSVSHCQLSVSSTYSDDSSTAFSVKLPPFIFWVNFRLVNLLLDLLKQVVNSSEINNKRECFESKAFREEHDPSCRMKRGTCPYVTTLSPKGSLKGSIFLTDARIILCFPFENYGDFGRYSSWDKFVALDFSSVLSKEKVLDAYPILETSSQKEYSSTASSSIHFNIGNLNIYLITDAVVSGAIHNSTFSAQRILSVTSRTSCCSVISMLWQEGPVTGTWMTKRARSLATSQESRSRNNVLGKGYEFASVTYLKDQKDINSRTRQEMILGSAFFLHIRLSPVLINLGSSQYQAIHHLLNQVMDGFSRVAHDTNTTPGHSVKKEASASQTSVLVECDSVEILIDLDIVEDIKCSIQKDLPGSWHRLKLKIQKFEFLSVSNIGAISGANFVWVGHGEGDMWGSTTGVPTQDFLLISCSNSTMRRGDGEGANVLSSGSAGIAIIHLWDPQNSQSCTSITVRCGTIVAPGGRLDWLNAICDFFALPSPEKEQEGNNSLQEQSTEDYTPYEASFILYFIDIALSYEPHIQNLVVNSDILESESNRSAKVRGESSEQYMTCLLAAASLNLSSQSVANSMDNDYKIRVQDLGLLLCALSGSEDLRGIYSMEYLHKIGYVKVAGEALVEAVLRTNCKNGLLWEVECTESHINLDTCHDTTAGLILLAAQLQQLFAPDVEESIVHLQTRWNNVQQTQDRHDIINKTFTVDSGSASSATSLDASRRSGVVGLMDEICEDAFLLNGTRTSSPDSCESEFHISFDDCVLGDRCNIGINTPEIFSNNIIFNRPIPGMELESTHTSPPQKDWLPEFIEGHYLSELCPLPELSEGNQPLIDENLKSKKAGHGDVESGNTGWYKDTSLRILENHISNVSEQPGGNKFIGEYKLPSVNCTRPDVFGKARGRILLKNIDVRWKMYAGSDWHDLGKNIQLNGNTSGRDTTVCLELSLSGMDLQYDMFPDGEICASKLSLSVQDFHLYDSSKDAPWKLVLGYYHSIDHPRESSAKAFKLDLEAVRPDPLTPLEEYRLRLAFLPLLLHLHQGQLDFLTSFFGEKGSSIDQSQSLPQDLGVSGMSPTKSSNFGGHDIAEEALLPYFQKFDIWPVLVRVDYSPCRLDLAALRGGKYVELVNLFPWKGVEMQLKHVHAVGVYGWSSVCETIVGEWLEDISQNQIHKLLKGLPTIRSLFAVGSGAAKLVSLPVKSYRKDHRLLKGMQRGAIAFLRSISVEAVGLGVHLAAGAHEILLQTEYILTSIPPSVPCSVRSKTKTNVRSNQPKDAQQGIQQAYESLSDGLGKTASALVGTPLKTYQRGAGAGSVLASAVRAAPVAAIAPASATARAVHCALLGIRNSLDPEHKKESIEKYLGPTQPRDHS